VATQGDVITNGYTDKAIDYDTYLATIYRLIGKPAVGGTPDYKGFID
jgi:hypothetical protein